MNKIPPVKLTLVNKKSISIMVTLPGTTTRKFKSLDIELDADQWDSKAEMVKKSHPDAARINSEIWSEKNKLADGLKKDKEAGVTFTVAHIVHRLNFDYSNPASDFYAFAKEQIALADYAPETKKTYYSMITKMQQYAPTLSFADITFQWLQKYCHYMRTKLGNDPNTVWKSLKFMRRIFTLAIKFGGIVEKNVVSDFGVGSYEQGIPFYLEWPDVQKLHRKITKGNIPDDLRLIGYYTLLSYYSGLRFGDAVSFRYDSKVMEDSSGKRLILSAAKNGKIVSIAFTKYIEQVVEYIKDRPIKITNQEFNEALKKIAAGIGLPNDGADVTSHTARHSFAMRCAELDMSIDEVQKLLGHLKRSSTEVYFEIKNKRLDKAMKKWK